MILNVNTKYREGQTINNVNGWGLKVIAVRVVNLHRERFGVEYLVSDDNGVEFWGDALELEYL